MLDTASLLARHRPALTVVRLELGAGAGQGAGQLLTKLGLPAQPGLVALWPNNK